MLIYYNFSEICNDLQVDEKEYDGKLSFDTFDLTYIMNCFALMASSDVEQDNTVTSENGKFYLMAMHKIFANAIILQMRKKLSKTNRK